MTASFGTRAVNSVQVSPAVLEQMDDLKATYANLIDYLDALRASTADGEVKRYAALAITELETSCMYATKALSRRG